VSTCPLPWCKSQHLVGRPLCADHARIASGPLHDALVRAYNPHRPHDEQGGGFWIALLKIDAWIRKTFGGQDERPRPSWETLKTWVRSRDAARGRPTPAICLQPWTPNQAQPAPQLRLVP
jgi:hypothetical protein